MIFFVVAKLLDLKKLWPKSEEFFKNESGKSIYMYGVGGQKIGFLFFLQCVGNYAGRRYMHGGGLRFDFYVWDKKYHFQRGGGQKI